MHLIIYTAADSSSSEKKKVVNKRSYGRAKKKAPTRKKEELWYSSQEDSDEYESEEEEESDDSGKDSGGYSSGEEDDDDDVLTTPEQLKKDVEVWVKCSGDPRHKEWPGVVCADATPKGVYITLDDEKKAPKLVPIKDVSLMFPPKNAKQRGERKQEPSKQRDGKSKKTSTTTTPKKVAPKVSRKITPTKGHEAECEYSILLFCLM